MQPRCASKSQSATSSTRTRADIIVFVSAITRIRPTRSIAADGKIRMAELSGVVVVAGEGDWRTVATMANLITCAARIVVGTW